MKKNNMSITHAAIPLKVSDIQVILERRVVPALNVLFYQPKSKTNIS